MYLVTPKNNMQINQCVPKNGYLITTDSLNILLISILDGALGCTSSSTEHQSG